MPRSMESASCSMMESSKDGTILVRKKPNRRNRNAPKRKAMLRARIVKHDLYATTCLGRRETNGSVVVLVLSRCASVGPSRKGFGPNQQNDT